MHKERTRVLIAVKTYPNLSRKYGELVCTAGFRQNGEWVRIYPVPFRSYSNENRFRKYEWIELDLQRNPKDFRPESYRPADPFNEQSIVRSDFIPPDGGAWTKRREICLQRVWTDLADLITEAKGVKKTSLATFKPARMIGFDYIEDQREWDAVLLENAQARRDQLDLFEPSDEPHEREVFNLVEKIPYKFYYTFEDINGKQSRLMIEDWEICQLYRNCLKDGDEAAACAKVRQKYWDDFAQTKDLHLFLGTTFQYHLKNAPNPFVIIGTFHPKAPDPQLNLFDIL